MSDDAFTRTEDSAALREKVRILQRHVDHLLGQLLGAGTAV